MTLIWDNLYIGVDGDADETGQYLVFHSYGFGTEQQ